MKESKFDKLAKEIAEDYEDKGKSPQEAMEIGEATAAKIGRAKFGKRKFAKMGQKAEYEAQSTKRPQPNTSLKGADLSGYDLTGADLSGANLTGAILQNANLREAHLKYANLRDADLTGADLSGANLSNADLFGADLSYADLSFADMIGADLSGADLTDVKKAEQLDKDFDMDKADRNKDGEISDWEQAVGNKVAKGIRESDKSSSKDSVQAVLDGYRAANKGSLMILTPILVGLGLVEIYKRVSDKPESSEVSAAEVADNSETSEPFDRMPGATQIVDNMVQRRKANNVLFEKNAPTLWPSGGLTVVNMIDAIQRGDNLPEFPTTKI